MVLTVTEIIYYVVTCVIAGFALGYACCKIVDSNNIKKA